MKTILFLLLSCLAFGQVIPPFDSTATIYLTRYAQGANPGANALNYNWYKIDKGIKDTRDTINNKVGLYWKGNVWTAGQTFAGGMTLTGNLTHSGVTVDTTASRTWVRTNLPALSNYIPSNTSSTATGLVTFGNGGIAFTSNSPYLNLPVAAGGDADNQVANSIYGDETRIMYSKSGGASTNRDTVVFFSSLRPLLNALNFQMIPSGNKTLDFGSSSKKWKDGYFRSVTADTFYVTEIRNPVGDTISVVQPIKVPNISFSDSVYTIGSKDATVSPDTIYTKNISVPTNTARLSIHANQTLATGNLLKSIDTVTTEVTGDIEVLTDITILNFGAVKTIDIIYAKDPGYMITLINGDASNNITISVETNSSPPGSGNIVSTSGDDIVLGYLDALTLVSIGFGAEIIWIPISLRDN